MDPARPRVLSVTTSLEGGPAHQAVYLTDELRHRGFDTRLVWGGSAPGEGTVDPSSGVPHTHIPWLVREVRPTEDLRATMALAGIVRRWHPDVVHTHLAKAGTIGRGVALRAHVPVVAHTFHDIVTPSYRSRMKHVAFSRVERSLGARTGALIAVTPQIREGFLALGVGTEDRWHVIPVGVNLGPLLHDRVDPAEARARLGLPAEGAVVGVVGRLVSIEDHATFLRAARWIAAGQPDTTFVVAGDGDLREDLVLDSQATLGDRVRFLGWVGDLPSLYAACDVVVRTSRREGTPAALIEASAAGRPVVATDVIGVREVVLPTKTGDLVPAGDHRAVADAVTSLLGDPARSAAYGKSGAAHVRDRFARERLAQDLADLYSELLARRGAASAGMRRITAGASNTTA